VTKAYCRTVTGRGTVERNALGSIESGEVGDVVGCGRVLLDGQRASAPSRRVLAL
jgi:hypothetical protein